MARYALLFIVLIALVSWIFELLLRHVLGGVYAVDKQLELQSDGVLRVDDETEQRLKKAVDDLVEAVNLR